ncbi:MAG: crossover junction endodeoxyribonuclease RuvC [Flavobacteriales bacterium]
MAVKKPVQERIILGIDPGTSVMGYGIIMAKGKKMELMRMGVIRLSKYPDHAVKMKKIFDRVCQLIEEFSPDELAIEAPFFGKNVQSMLKLGRAQGVSIAAALRYDMSYVEYAPRKIKQSITGNGNCSKEQVAAMLQTTLKIPASDMPKDLDATDGLAAAVCHFYQSNTSIGGKSYSSWKSFINENPSRAGKK